VNDTCHVIIQDFGPGGGGWGLAAWHEIAQLVHEHTGLSTKLIRYERPVELESYEAKRKEHLSYDEASEHLPAG
jgi:hypothetical protein